MNVDSKKTLAILSHVNLWTKQSAMLQQKDGVSVRKLKQIKLIGFLWIDEVTASLADEVLGFFTKSLAELTLSCKLNWPHSVPEGSFNIPSLTIFSNFCLSFFLKSIFFHI
jgi:hypothetical protein